MARPEVTGRKSGGDERATAKPEDKRAKAKPEDKGATAKPLSVQAPPIAAYSIPEFCYAHRISVDHYYKLQREGKGPDTMKAGARTLITNEAAGRWREEGEAAARETRKSKETVD